MKNKKIVFTIPAIAGGGMGRAVLNFAEPLSKMGYDVAIFLLTSKRIEKYPTPENVKIQSGVKTNYSKIKFPSSLISLRNFCVKNKVDYVFSFSGQHSCYVVMSLLTTKVKVFAFHRANPFLKYGFINDLLNRLLFPLSSGLIVQTELARRIFKEKYNHKNIIVVPNPVKDIKISSSVKREKIIITVSRLIKSKRVDKLLSIFNEVASTTPEWELWIVGDGPEKRKIEDLINLSPYKNRIKLLGFRSDVDKLLSKASIFAFTSESEGYPNALLEAMCSGLACISYDCVAGPSDIIDNEENGFLIENGNEKMYVSRLKRLMLDESLRLKFSQEATKLNIKNNSFNIVSTFIGKINNIK